MATTIIDALSPESGRRYPDPELVVDRIVDVARSSFAELGYDATSMRSIALAAGVDPRLVGYYFGSKRALLEACLVPPPGFVENIVDVTSSELASRGEALVRSRRVRSVRQSRSPATATVVRDARRDGLRACPEH
jgi:hypothetical protein